MNTDVVSELAWVIDRGALALAGLLIVLVILVAITRPGDDEGSGK